MSLNYPEYIEGDPIPSSKRICNVVICKDCDFECLLGQRNKDGTRPDDGHNITMRKNPTLISKSTF